MCLRFVFLLITRVVAWLRLSRREEAWRITEILILRHQLAVLQRPCRPKLNWADRALLATLLGVIPKARRHGLRLLVTPDTILRWHRDIIRRRWAARSIRGKTGRPATRRNIKTLILRLASTWASRASATIHAIRRSILASDGGCRRHPASARHPSGGRTRAGGRTRRLGRVARGISAPGSHRSVRDSLPSYGSCRPGHLAAGFAQAQCAKYRGRFLAASARAWTAFFQVRSFLYLFMSHRSR